MPGQKMRKCEKENDDYSTDDIIGKTGVEQLMETQLQGTDGSEKVVVDRLGKIL
ncbi:MAG TPA: hypothetical protein IAA17_10500, partial [Candidatus Lachnoclostridium stercorigallinarum]|nr:hypothetical protein [Candidatus Lachnoclostridium stercorigallinarum]